MLAFGLIGIVAKDIAFAPLAVADNDLFGLQIVFNDRVAAALAEHIPFDFSHAAHPAGQQVFAASLCQLSTVVFGVHARVGDKQSAAQVPARRSERTFSPCSHRLCFWAAPTSNRNAFPGNCQGNHHLGAPGSLFTMAEAAQRRVRITCRVIFIVHGKRSGRGIVEDQVHFQIEQVGDFKKYGLFHLVRISIKHIHGFVHVMQLQSITGRFAASDPRRPVIGRTKAVGHHRQNRSL